MNMVLVPYLPINQDGNKMGLNTEDSFSQLTKMVNLKLFLMALASLMTRAIKNLPAVGKPVPSLGQENILERKWQPKPVFLPGKSHLDRGACWPQSMESQKWF